MGYKMVNRDSIQKFAADRCLKDVEHYQSDAFLTYKEMLDMPLGSHAVVVVRTHGVDFYANWYKSCFEWPRTPASDWRHIYIVRRDRKKGVFCWDDVVDWEEATYEEASKYAEKNGSELLETKVVCKKCCSDSVATFHRIPAYMQCNHCLSALEQKDTIAAVEDYEFIDK